MPNISELRRLLNILNRLNTTTYAGLTKSSHLYAASALRDVSVRMLLFFDFLELETSCRTEGKDLLYRVLRHWEVLCFRNNPE
jgi:hypothetical protein